MLAAYSLVHPGLHSNCQVQSLLVQLSLSAAARGFPGALTCSRVAEDNNQPGLLGEIDGARRLLRNSEWKIWSPAACQVAASSIVLWHWQVTGDWWS
jgi:hypothetical protein